VISTRDFGSLIVRVRLCQKCMHSKKTYESENQDLDDMLLKIALATGREMFEVRKALVNNGA